MNLVYLIGPPGAGKSTTMAALTSGYERVYRPRPLHHELLVCPRSGEVAAVELGRWRPGFPGTDTLALNASPVACRWLAGRPAGLVLAEGDRLAHAGFLQAAEQAGYAVTVVYLAAVSGVLDARCAARGSAQSMAWRAGRATKAERLATWATGRYSVVTVDTGPGPVAAVVQMLRDQVPALAGLPVREVGACTSR